MRAKLIDMHSIPAVVAEMTLEEKVLFLTPASACTTRAFPERNIPSIRMADGGTGVNGTLVVLDYLTGLPKDKQIDQGKFWVAAPQLLTLDVEQSREQYKYDPLMAGVVEDIAKSRPQGKDYICFPSGVNIGATWNMEKAEQLGQSVGWEMRNSGIDVSFGPNVDIQKNPLGGRNYEMYGEDPFLTSKIGASFIRGLQTTGVGACAKHYIANNQETNRQVVDTHVSTRALLEVYAKGFMSAVKEAGVKAIMSAYNSVNGSFSSYNYLLLTEWLKGDWGFEGIIVSDYGAVTGYQEQALMAGLDMILPGPYDMSGSIKALEDGTLSMERVDDAVSRILKLIVELRDIQEQVPAQYDVEQILMNSYDTLVDGCVLLKNNNQVLPISDKEPIAVWGKRAKEWYECGTGSTFVTTAKHSNVWDELKAKCYQNSISYEEWNDAKTLVYVASVISGENSDRDNMDLEAGETEKLDAALKEAKNRGLQTVVILNICGPVSMHSWIENADAVYCMFIPGYMGAKAAVDVLLGKANPAGKLPVTFPVRLEDAPEYPNFPGKYEDVYYGDDIFIGYRSYEKRKLPVQYPFGYGLSYTSFDLQADLSAIKWNVEKELSISISVNVTNTGKIAGGEVVQLYLSENNPHLLRSLKELKAFKKVYLNPGETKEVIITLDREQLYCYEPELHKWIIPVGKYTIRLGTSSVHLPITCEVMVIGRNPYPLGEDPTLQKVMDNLDAVAVIEKHLPGFLVSLGDEGKQMLHNHNISAVLQMFIISRIPDAVEAANVIKQITKEISGL